MVNNLNHQCFNHLPTDCIPADPLDVNCPKCGYDALPSVRNCDHISSSFFVVDDEYITGDDISQLSCLHDISHDFNFDDVCFHVLIS